MTGSFPSASSSRPHHTSSLPSVFHSFLYSNNDSLMEPHKKLTVIACFSIRWDLDFLLSIPAHFTYATALSFFVHLCPCYTDAPGRMVTSRSSSSLFLFDLLSQCIFLLVLLYSSAMKTFWIIGFFLIEGKCNLRLQNYICTQHFSANRWHLQQSRQFICDPYPPQKMYYLFSLK